MEKVKAVAHMSRSWMTDGVTPRPPISASSPTAPGWTAPSPSMTSASPTRATLPLPSGPVTASTPAISTTVPTDPSAILDELVAYVDGVRAAILASVDGFGLARSSSMPDEASHPAMLAAAIGLARQLVALGGGAQLRQLVVDHDGGLMLVWPIGEQRVLAILAVSGVEQQRLRSFVQARATWLAGAPS
jgi:predicted regulator of Ras-like GTPase activity (Roadblock/LC7/MglB family)